MAEKNIAALLREDARTVHVTFEELDFEPFDGSENQLRQDHADRVAQIHQQVLAGRFTVSEVNSRVYESERKLKERVAALKKKPTVKTYTYVTDIADLQAGDRVVVDAAEETKIAYVAHVDDEVKIEPNSTTTYKWVIAKIDLTAYNANMARNAEIEMTVADAYRNNLRRSFAQQILAGLDETKAAEIRKLTAKS